jgi:hypothetical protein
MPPHDPAAQTDDHDAEPSGTAQRPERDRHDRRSGPAAPRSDRTGPRSRTGPRRTTGPRFTLGPPRVVPMTPEQREQAIRLWAALIAAWWKDHPPNDEPN